MEQKPWESFTAAKVEIIGGTPYVEARYLEGCVAENARLKEELDDATDYNKTTYLTASERKKLQAELNASLRQRLDAMPNVELDKERLLLGDYFTHDRTGVRFVCVSVTQYDCAGIQSTKAEVKPA